MSIVRKTTTKVALFLNTIIYINYLFIKIKYY